jgi:hypothetical protein
VNFRAEIEVLLAFLRSTNAADRETWPYSSLRYWHSHVW